MPTSKITTVAIDSGKELFQIGYGDQHGCEVGEQLRLESREELESFIGKSKPILRVGSARSSATGSVRSRFDCISRPPRPFIAR